MGRIYTIMNVLIPLIIAPIIGFGILVVMNLFPAHAQTFKLDPQTVACLQRSQKLVWEPVPDSSIKQYRIYADKNYMMIKDPEKRLKLAPVATLPWTHTEYVLPGKLRKTLYYYAVVSINMWGQVSDPSEIISCQGSTP